MHEPFTTIDVVQPVQGTYFAACVQRKILCSHEQIQEYVRKYCDYHLYEITQLHKLTEAIVTQYNDDFLGIAHDAPIPSHIPINELQTIIENVSSAPPTQTPATNNTDANNPTIAEATPNANNGIVPPVQLSELGT
jgi:hypothetical protein